MTYSTNPFLNITLIKANEQYENKAYEETNLELSLEIYQYSISLYIYLKSKQSITKYDCDEFEIMADFLKRIEDKIGNNQFITSTKKKFKDITEILVEKGDDNAKYVQENTRAHSTTRPKFILCVLKIKNDFE